MNRLITVLALVAFVCAGLFTTTTAPAASKTKQPTRASIHRMG